MRKVIFVCLLSLSVCFGQQNLQQAAAPQLSSTEGATNTTATEEKAPTAKPEHPQTVPAVPAETKPSNTTTGSVVPKPVETQNATATSTNAPQTAPTPNETFTKSNETKPEKDNTTDVKPNKDAPKPADEKKVEPSKDKNESKTIVPAGKVTNGTSTDKDAKKNETTTPKGENVSPTVAPIQTKTRAFDGPSFIGGIILTLGLLAIGFMGFKYYKNQTERNYHTL